MQDIPERYLLDNRKFNLDLWFNDIYGAMQICDYFPHRVEVSSSSDISNKRSKWIIDNLQQIWGCGSFKKIDGNIFTEVYFFRDINEATLFKLYWG